MTCYGCGEQGHMQQACTKRRRDVTKTDRSPPTSWARVLSQRIQDGDNTEHGRDSTIHEETLLQPQAQQPGKTDTGGPSDYPQSLEILDDKEA